MTEMYYDSIFYTKSDIRNQTNLENMTWFQDSQPLIISGLTVVGCILSFALGFLIRYNNFKQKIFLNKINKANHMIFLVDKDVTGISESFTIQNEK